MDHDCGIDFVSKKKMAAGLIAHNHRGVLGHSQECWILLTCLLLLDDVVASLAHTNEATQQGSALEEKPTITGDGWTPRAYSNLYYAIRRASV